MPVDTGVFKSFAEALTSAKNLLKIAAKLEVVEKKKRCRKTDLAEAILESYKRHVAEFINRQTDTTSVYYLIRADFPVLITSEDLMKGQKGKEVTKQNLLDQANKLITELRNEVKPHYDQLLSMNDLPSGWNVAFMLKTILKRIAIVNQSNKDKVDVPAINVWTVFTALPDPEINDLPKSWHAFLLFSPICRDIYNVEPPYKVFESVEKDTDAGIANDANSGRKQQRKAEAEENSHKREEESGRGIPSQRNFENGMLEFQKRAKVIDLVNKEMESKLKEIAVHEKYGNVEFERAAYSEYCALSKRLSALNAVLIEDEISKSYPQMERSSSTPRTLNVHFQRSSPSETYIDLESENNNDEEKDTADTDKVPHHKRCCCGCNEDASTQNHYCIMTGKRIFAWHTPETEPHGFGSKGYCNRCIVNKNTSTII